MKVSLVAFGIFFLLLALTSCRDEPSTYKYEEGLIQYLQEAELGSLLDKDQDLIIIPTSGCNPCMETALKCFKQHTNLGIAILFSGGPEASAQAQEIISEQQIFVDGNNSIRKFETGIFGPSLVNIKQNHVVKVTNLTAYTVDEFFNNIQNARQ